MMPFSFFRSGPVVIQSPNLAGDFTNGRFIRICLRRSLLVLILIFDSTVGDYLPRATVSALQEGNLAPAIRSCGRLDEETAAAKLPKRKKNNSRLEQPSYIPSCLEVNALPLVVQERLQQFVRQENWAIFDEEINEVLWNFSLPLTKDDLLAYANPPAGTDRVSWERGRAVVLVRTVSLNDGYSRTTVAAQFRGFGESDDTFAMQRSFWEWSSNGKLEARLTGELRTRFGAH
jgi:hypothetical protein